MKKEKQTIKELFKIALLPILIILLSILMITLSEITTHKIKYVINENNSLLSSKIKLSYQLSDKEKEISTLKELNNNLIIDKEASDYAGRYVSNILDKIDNLYIRYDEVFVNSYNYCVNNVVWDYAGQADMKWFLKQQQQIQKDYTNLVNSLNNDLNSNNN